MTPDLGSLLSGGMASGDESGERHDYQIWSHDCHQESWLQIYDRFRGWELSRKMRQVILYKLPDGHKIEWKYANSNEQNVDL